ncbi:MAG: serine/threonine protein kinase, partial [Sandaracinaceae bacterium]|nr:serine/threonine protein kinase [Sandaracinaceae bacterium]
MSPPAQATPSSLEGSVLGGRYRVGKRLGEGGMGAVYEALQVDIGRRVALKLLHPELSEDAELVARFRREAEASASLGDPNIVQVTDFGHSEEHGAFLVMELLSGAPLASVLANEGKLPPARVAFIAHQVLGALASAHRAGIVHRDLKPDNVFLTSVSGIADIVKLLDFGIAKLIANDGGQRTATGVVLGTPAYMSPEQARGREVDARTDLYAVGVLMYQALSGRLPYRASNYNAILFAIIEETPPPLGELRPDLDPSLIAVIERAMAKEPSDRFASAEEMREALEPFLRPATDLAAFPRTRRVEAAREPTPLELAPTMTTPVVDRP